MGDERSPLLGKCSLCRWPVVRMNSGVHGSRCIRCFSTQVHRAVCIVIESLHLSNECNAYEMSARGALHRYMRRRFRNFYFSEFFDDVPRGGQRNGVPCQDVQNLTLGDGLFDLVTSTEVFEHVADDMRGFSEVRRILKDGGHFIFTVPFMEGKKTLERALMRADGTIEHVLPPEYHSDRIRGRRAVLAFRTYGKDLESRLVRAGFSVEIRKITLPDSAIYSQHVVVAQKSGKGTAGRLRD